MVLVLTALAPQASATTADDGALSAVASKAVTVRQPVGPTAAIKAPVTVQVGENVVLESTSKAGDAAITNTTWSIAGKAFYGFRAQVAFADAGTKQVTLTVTDALGRSDTATADLIVTAAPAPTLAPGGEGQKAKAKDAPTPSVLVLAGLLLLAVAVRKRLQ